MHPSIVDRIILFGRKKALTTTFIHQYVSKINNKEKINFTQRKELISDRAFKIKAIKEMLEKEKIQFEVVPEFKY